MDARLPEEEVPVKRLTKEEIARAFIDMYEGVDGVADEMSRRDLDLVNEHYPMYLEAKALLGEQQKVVEALDAVDSARDGESGHSEADRILLAYVPQEIREAYDRVVERSDFWACA